jgi:hypothetical protein
VTRPHAAAAAEADLVPGPVYGLRTWLVDGAAGAERLVGAHTRTAWPPGGARLDAVCSIAPGHAAPVPGCTCGLYAWHPTRAAARRVCAVRREVPGILEVAGAVEVHDEGFRAARGRPHALVLLPGRNASQLERLARTYGTELLRLPGPDALAAHCRTHGLGLTEPVVAALVGPDKLAADRRARHRRARATALRIGAVALALAAVALLANRPAEPGKVLNGRTGEVRVR